MSTTTLYLIEIFPTLARFMAGAGLGLAVIGAALALASCNAHPGAFTKVATDYESHGAFMIAQARHEKQVNESHELLRRATLLMIASLCCFFSFAVVPSREGFYRIYLLNWVTTSSVATQLPEKLQEYLNVLIDNAKK